MEESASPPESVVFKVVVWCGDTPHIARIFWNGARVCDI